MKFRILLCIFFEESINSHRQTNSLILQPCIYWNDFFVGCPGRLLRGDTSNELGTFEKLDRKIRNRTLGWSGFQHAWYRNCKTMRFKYGGVFLRKNAKHSFENAFLIRIRGHFSRMPQIGLMSVARFSWVTNLYNLHLLLENHMCQPDPVNSYRDRISIQTFCGCWGQSRAAMVVRRCAVCRGLAGHRQAVLTCKQPLGCGEGGAGHRASRAEKQRT